MCVLLLTSSSMLSGCSGFAIAGTISLVDVFSGLLTPLIAVIVAYIAWQQWRTNSLRLKHELFDRRIDLYNNITGFLANILVAGRVPPQAEDQFLRDTRSTVFVFDKETEEFVKTIYEKAVALHALDAELEGLEGTARSANIEQQREIKDWLDLQLKECPDRFSRFLSLG